ncbi:IS3 family transposase [Streptomyces sp. NPDC060000]|uniref:IS3 family transposase n=1 Tax=Streptomyces sp. NPDC060000 TaxID=3347031 RepID=UPI00367DF2A8
MLIKTECIRGRTFDTRAEANLALFEYIDGFHRVRREALRRPGNGRTSEPENTSTCPDLLVSHSRAAGEPHSETERLGPPGLVRAGPCPERLPEPLTHARVATIRGRPSRRTAMAADHLMTGEACTTPKSEAWATACRLLRKP